MQMPSVQISRLSKGLDSYYESLEAMANFVRLAATDYRLKQFANSLFRQYRLKGHSFQKEIEALFFSVGTGFGIRATR